MTGTEKIRGHWLRVLQRMEGELTLIKKFEQDPKDDIPPEAMEAWVALQERWCVDIRMLIAQFSEGSRA